MMSLIAYLTLVTLTFHGRMTNDTGGAWLNTCTAVYVSPQTALTAAHCVRDVKDNKMWVRTSDGKSFEASIIRRDNKRDLALLSIKGPKRPYVKLGSPAKVGDAVYSVNSGAGLRETYGEGYVANVIIDSDLNYTPMVLHTAAVRRGASGSGLFDKRGRLIGINTISMGALSEAVDIVPIRHFLEETELLLTLPQ